MLKRYCAIFCLAAASVTTLTGVYDTPPAEESQADAQEQTQAQAQDIAKQKQKLAFEYVTGVQEFIKEVRWINPVVIDRVAVNGTYDHVTDQALQSVQRYYNMDVVRVIDKTTVPKLTAAVEQAEQAYARLHDKVSKAHETANQAFAQPSDRQNYQVTLEASARYYLVHYLNRHMQRGIAIDVYEKMMHAAHEMGCDAAAMIKLAEGEAHFDPNAHVKSTDGLGVMQFTPGTWLGYIRDFGHDMGLDEKYLGKVHWQENFTTKRNAVGTYTVDANGNKKWRGDSALRKELLELRRDPALSMKAACLYAQSNQKILEQGVIRGYDDQDKPIYKKKKGIPLSPYTGEFGRVELKLTHLLDGETALRFLHIAERHPKHAAADYFPSAAKHNPSVFYFKSKDGQRWDRKKSFLQVRVHILKMMGGQNMLYTNPPPVDIHLAAIRDHEQAQQSKKEKEATTNLAALSNT